MKDEGFDVCLYRDPGDTPVGEAIRKLVKDPAIEMLPITQMLLYTAARAELSARMQPWILGGGHVILDRWWPSTYAYQGMGGVDEDLILRLVEETTPQGPDPQHFMASPNLTFYIEVPVEVAMRRSGALDSAAAGIEHGKDRFEVQGRKFQEDLAGMYERLVMMGRMRAVRGDILPVDLFAQHLWETFIRPEL